jgi:mannose-6-phosphate isomerase-like protein (cupin superfamily)
MEEQTHQSTVKFVRPEADKQAQRMSHRPLIETLYSLGNKSSRRITAVWHQQILGICFGCCPQHHEEVFHHKIYDEALSVEQGSMIMQVTILDKSTTTTSNSSKTKAQVISYAISLLKCGNK